MTTATFTPDRTIPRSRRLALALRAIRAYGTAAVDVVVLGRYAEEAGVRNPRPRYVGGPD
ncbi:hypothetical protein M5362_27355 [Streptomyces sp. Je 1-79]|uniref:hypothetical protein n=1 Tax=Streptomyces sp. Je 1-79 TaxID=2943847 RepID=UPI0021A565FB|nr:hypothetical protein [Streptomyces sp. Je 1-79]MCT4356843.1 hypothetical protein [Streptomyces sp. Je 1-79]